MRNGSPASNRKAKLEKSPAAPVCCRLDSGAVVDDDGWHYGSTMRTEKDEIPTHKLFLLLLIGSVFVCLAASTALTRAPYCDEGWFASPALNLVQNGFMGTTVLDPAGISDRCELQGIQKHTYWALPLHFLVQATWYRVVGFGLFAMRALSVVSGIFAVGAWYTIIWKLAGNSRVALLGAALLGVDQVYVWVAADGRMDMMSLALGSGGLAAYLVLREKHPRAALLVAGTFIALAGLTHPNAITAFFAMAIFAFPDRHRIGWSGLALSAVPFVVLAAAYGLYILQSPADFVAQMKCNGSGRLGLAHPLQALKDEVEVRYGNWLFGLGPSSTGFARAKVLLLAGYILALFANIAIPEIRRSRVQKMVLTLTAVNFLSLAFLNLKFTNYLIYMIPLYAAGLAIFVNWCWQRRVLRRTIVAGLVAFVTLQLVSSVHRMARLDTYHRNYLPAAAFLQQRLATGQKVIGSAALAFQVGFDRVTHDDYLGFYSGQQPEFLFLDDDSQAGLDYIRRNRPDQARYVNRVLSGDFRLIYQHNSYEVYQRIH
jgi:4-amino-4-deoxy-L-arabinose transferase-like glycosyltransferase